MTGEQFAPIDKPYLKQWQERIDKLHWTDSVKKVKAAKPVGKKRKGRKKAKR